MKKWSHSSPPWAFRSRRFRRRTCGATAVANWLKELTILQVKTPWAHTFSRQMTTLSKLDSSHASPWACRTFCLLLVLLSLRAAVPKKAALLPIFLCPTYREGTHCLPSACQHKTSDYKSNWTIQTWQDPSEDRGRLKNSPFIALFTEAKELGVGGANRASDAMWWMKASVRRLLILSSFILLANGTNYD